ncbi:Bacterial shufflon protein, N-terminal constant region [Serratia grimesii]|uniref:shufflon system plasmid conjugative transfer pilus tip adhesin PilV n=1 Tax=Serratia grimesii TaxID=82995 RepID=UPI002179FF15|nr:shufflon system plasmid conjugative transfer pilus tip adhesin PilV [Serratia grimesii]CAI1684510.1 Bacterial shufflon protein, N-terminal constant region [Serratia grimesii]
MKKQNKKGFSLLELVLVLGVGSMMAFMRFQDMKNEQETVMAKAVGQQMKQMGEATNRYISIRYDKLSTLTASSSQSSDPGPRTCDSSDCEITYQTLVNEGLLPASYTGVNAQKSSYKILLKRSGTIPNYVINGLITTTLPWSEGGKFRYDLLGKAMQEAGVDSGMTQSATVASGLQGAWKETSTVYSNITSAGLMAYRVGYDSAMYSVYLRRDGTLPMTGDLNMGGNSITNIKDINASGTGNFDNNLNVSKDLTVGGVINSGKGIISNDYIYAKGDFSTDGIAYVRKSVNAGENMYAVGNIGVAADSNKNMAAALNADGTVYAKKAFVTDGDIYANSGTVNTSYVWASGNINSNYIHSNGSMNADGRINAGEFVYINGQSSTGSGCSPNGLMGRTNEGQLLSCINGIWNKSKYNYSEYVVSYVNNSSGSCESCYQIKNIGKHLFCALSADQTSTKMVKHSVVYFNGTDWIMEMRVTSWPEGINTWMKAMCFD